MRVFNSTKHETHRNKRFSIDLNDRSHGDQHNSLWNTTRLSTNNQDHQSWFFYVQSPTVWIHEIEVGFGNE